MTEIVHTFTVAVGDHVRIDPDGLVRPLMGGVVKGVRCICQELDRGVIYQTPDVCFPAWNLARVAWEDGTETEINVGWLVRAARAAEAYRLAVMTVGAAKLAASHGDSGVNEVVVERAMLDRLAKGDALDSALALLRGGAGKETT